MADNSNKDAAAAAALNPDVVQDAELQNVETRTEQVAMHEPDAKPWYRTPHIIRLNLLMVRTHLVTESLARGECEGRRA